MELNKDIIENKQALEEKGFKIFSYDREKVKEETLNAPIWIHFGAGNIFRGFPAALQDALLETERSKKGIVVVESYDTEIIDAVYKPCNNLSLLVTLRNDGSIEKQIIGSIVESLKIDEEKDWHQLVALFRNEALQMVTFTITEKGYITSNQELDFKKFPNESKSLMGRLTYLCYERYLQGGVPLSLVSLDNCSKNGKKLQEAVLHFAKEWIKRGKIEAGFINYIEDANKLAFPWSMIDKITPHPSEMVQALLEESGVESTRIIKTEKNTYIAPFVNAEETQYLVIEDRFPNGRPPLEEVGILFTSRETVECVERMKVCTCLNPLHTALAIFGCLLGYQRIYDEMENSQLKRLVERIGYEEGLPVVTDPKIINPREFINEVIEKRLPNPFIPDSPWRIIADTSQKLPIRFGETIKAYVASNILEPEDLRYIPLTIAGWCRYLMGIDDSGNTFEVGPDPMAVTLKHQVESIYLQEYDLVSTQLRPILSDATLFGVNLYQVNLGSKVEDYFREFIAGTGAVQRTLEKYLI